MKKISFQKGLEQLSGLELNIRDNFKQRLNGELYITYSPFVILSASKRSESMKDDDVTWVLTKRNYSIFTRELLCTGRK